MNITETKQLLTFIALLSSAIKDSLSDGSINFMDIDELFAPIMASKDAFTGLDMIPGELSNLDSDEAAELTRVFSEQFDLNGIEAESITEDGLKLSLSLIAFVNRLRGATA